MFPAAGNLGRLVQTQRGAVMGSRRLVADVFVQTPYGLSRLLRAGGLCSRLGGRPVSGGRRLLSGSRGAPRGSGDVALRWLGPSSISRACRASTRGIAWLSPRPGAARQSRVPAARWTLVVAPERTMMRCVRRGCQVSTRAKVVLSAERSRTPKPAIPRVRTSGVPLRPSASRCRRRTSGGRRGDRHRTHS